MLRNSRTVAIQLLQVGRIRGPLAEILWERGDRMLAKDGEGDCERELTAAEISALLAGDVPKDAM